MIGRYYTGVMILSVFGLFVMSIVVMINHTLSRTNKKLFIASYILTMAGALFEWGAYSLSATSAPIWLHTFVKTMELVIAPAIPLAVVPAIYHNRRLMKAMVAIALVNAAIEIVSAFTGFVFYVDAANSYHHGQFYFLYIAMYILETAGLLFATIMALRIYQGKNSLILLLVFLYMVTGIAMQLIDSTVRVDYITITIVLMFFYIVHEDIIRSSDSLTKMMNRHSYDTKLNNISDRSLIVNIDIDFFKQCNDSYGHLFGDEVLRITASIIRATLPKQGLCYRTGGDEFCVVIEDPSINPDSYLEHLHESMLAKRAIMPSLPFISTGYAIFEPAKESIFDAIERADNMMYKFKGLRKKLLAEGKEPTYPELLEILRNTPLIDVDKP